MLTLYDLLTFLPALSQRSYEMVSVSPNLKRIQSTFHLLGVLCHNRRNKQRSERQCCGGESEEDSGLQSSFAIGRICLLTHSSGAPVSFGVAFPDLCELESERSA